MATIRKSKTAAELKMDLEKAKQKVKELEQRAYAGELEEMVKKTSIVSDFNVIKANVKGATDLVILAAIGKAAGILRLNISQSDAPKRGPADPNKPKKTTAKATKGAKTSKAV